MSTPSFTQFNGTAIHNMLLMVRAATKLYVNSTISKSFKWKLFDSDSKVRFGFLFLVLQTTRQSLLISRHNKHTKEQPINFSMTNVTKTSTSFHQAFEERLSFDGNFLHLRKNINNNGLSSTKLTYSERFRVLMTHRSFIIFPTSFN